ncbi:MAG: hypothetical protein IJ358_01800 [Clostridia bacterium]|nr:hypothetical protein [Clostridia bacterium]
MVKIWLNCIICATILLDGGMETKTIQQYLLGYNQVEIVVNNECKTVEDIEKLNITLNKMLKDSRVMPAFGVSIHNETINAMQKGVWLRLSYDETKWVNGMNFDTLLINVEPKYSGFNIIRRNDGLYEGRCYYIDLANSTMQPLYDLINELQ